MRLTEAQIFARGVSTLRRHEPSPLPGTIGLPMWQVAAMQWRDGARKSAWDTLLRGQAEHVPPVALVGSGLGQLAPGSEPKSWFWPVVGVSVGGLVIYWIWDAYREKQSREREIVRREGSAGLRRIREAESAAEREDAKTWLGLHAGFTGLGILRDASRARRNGRRRRAPRRTRGRR